MISKSMQPVSYTRAVAEIESSESMHHDPTSRSYSMFIPTMYVVAYPAPRTICTDSATYEYLVPYRHQKSCIYILRRRYGHLGTVFAIIYLSKFRKRIFTDIMATLHASAASRTVRLSWGLQKTGDCTSEDNTTALALSWLY